MFPHIDTWLGIAAVVLAIAGVNLIWAWEKTLRQWHKLREYVNERCEQDEEIKFHTINSVLPLPCVERNASPSDDIVRLALARLDAQQFAWKLILGELGSGQTATLSVLYSKLGKTAPHSQPCSEI